MLTVSPKVLQCHGHLPIGITETSKHCEGDQLAPSGPFAAKQALGTSFLQSKALAGESTPKEASLAYKSKINSAVFVMQSDPPSRSLISSNPCICFSIAAGVWISSRVRFRISTVQFSWISSGTTSR